MERIGKLRRKTLLAYTIVLVLYISIVDKTTTEMLSSTQSEKFRNFRTAHTENPMSLYSFKFEFTLETG